MKRFIDALDTEGGVRFLWWLIGASLLIGFVVFLLVGANGPDDPSLEAREAVAGFGTVGFSIEHGAVTDDFCALLASTDASRQTGMMGRRDLSGYDAMVFAYPVSIEPSQVFFHNRNVPIDLSIAWFDDDGKFVSQNDMSSCPDREGCPQFRAAGRWKFAIEVPRGGLGRLGVDRGSVLTLKSAC